MVSYVSWYSFIPYESYGFLMDILCWIIPQIHDQIKMICFGNKLKTNVSIIICMIFSQIICLNHPYLTDISIHWILFSSFFKNVIQNRFLGLEFSEGGFGTAASSASATTTSWTTSSTTSWTGSSVASGSTSFSSSDSEDELETSATSVTTTSSTFCSTTTSSTAGSSTTGGIVSGPPSTPSSTAGASSSLELEDDEDDEDFAT